ncbi:MAG: hypothetical protein JNL60_03625, partial [Bacteroidia bacterium]|nr:hypothetical protein [Bacteroidia bacterium]
MKAQWPLYFILFGLSTVLKTQNLDSIKNTIASMPSNKDILKINLNNDGSHYFQATFLNQAWLRYNESNNGSTRFGRSAPETFDIGLRRTRIQLFGQITNRAFVYFQFGQNNFNNTSGYNSTANN